MGFFGSSAIKVAEKVVKGDAPDTTVNLLGRAASDVADGLDDLIDGDL